MKKSILLGLGACALVLGGTASLAGQKGAIKTQAEDPEPKTYYLCGNFADGYSNYSSLGSWKNVKNAYGATDGASNPLIVNLKAWESEENHEDIFKFVVENDWDDTRGYSSLGGTAAWCFSSDSNDNLHCNVTGEYYVYVSGSTLYVDYPDDFEFRYTGTSNGFTDGDVVKVNGDAISVSLTSEQTFRFKIENTWDHSIGFSELSDTFYKCFADANSYNNIYVNVTADYELSIRQENHALHIDASFSDMSTGVAYVLDLNGDLLAANHNAHVFNSSGAETTWPGASMSATTGASHIYEYEYLNEMDTIIFNNGTTQTNDFPLASKNGKCLILGWDYVAPKWTSMTWVSLDAAKFIDNYMKFAVHHENGGDGSGLCTSENWYSDAKAEYEKLSPEVRADVCNYGKVSDRLAAWAKANGDTFTVVAGVGSFGGAKKVSYIGNEPEDSGMATITIVISAAALCGASVLFFLRKKRAD